MYVKDAIYMQIQLKNYTSHNYLACFKKKCLINVCTISFKQQDHYAVLGLSKLRYKATENQIKKACKYRLFSMGDLSLSLSLSLSLCLSLSNKFRYYDNMFLIDKSMVLKHHPDKRKARGLKVGDGEDDYFTCITRGKCLVHSE